MLAAGQVEIILGLAAHTKVDRPKKKGDETMSLFPDNAPKPTSLFETSD